MRGRVVTLSRHALMPLVCLVTGALLATGAPVLAVAGPAAAVETTPAPDTSPRPDSVSAMTTARATGQRIEDLSQRTEYSKTYANPDGTWSEEDATTPEQVQDGQGEWHPVDTSLVPADGGLAPAHAASDLVLSDGGDATFATLTEDGKRLDWHWPTQLPTPEVDGNTATYPDAVPGGGDLVVTATATGFRHDIVLHHAPAGPVEFTIPVATHPRRRPDPEQDRRSGDHQGRRGHARRGAGTDDVGLLG